MSYEQLKKTISDLAKFAEDYEQIPLITFSMKLKQASSNYPDDHCLGVMSNIVSKMDNNSDKMFITRAEIKDLYRRLYTRNTKFAQLFSEELGNIEKAPEITVIKSDASKVDLIQEGFKQVIDPVLSDDLCLAFDTDVNTASNGLVSKAKMICENMLSEFAPSIKLEGKNSKAMVFRASFDTPKGVTSVYVPVRYDGRFVDHPAVFQGNSGVSELTKAALTDYLTQNAGEKLQYTVDSVLDITAELEGDGALNAVDIALMKMKTAPLPKTESMPTGEVSLPVFEDKQFNTFAETFDSPKGAAEFRFGKDKVKLAASMVLNNLHNYGFHTAQVKVAKSDEKSITFVVKANDVAFNVPVKLEKGVQEPTFLVVDNKIDEFSKEVINKIIAAKTHDYKALATASPLYDVKPSQLIETVEQAVSERNFKKAEDALNVLKEVHSNNEVAYKTAFDIYMSGLTASPQEKRSGCTKIIHNANHSEPVCGHLNMPLNKVFQDKYGTCRPLYRKNEEVSAGGYFMTNKIFI